MPTTIPAAVVRELRGALYHRIGSFGEDIATVNHEPRNAAQLAEWTEPIAVFNRFCALLGRIGWVAREPEQDAAQGTHRKGDREGRKGQQHRSELAAGREKQF